MGTRAYEGSELELFADAINWKRYWAGQVSKFVRGRVLDVGAGLGATAEALAYAEFESWTALEPDTDLCASIKARIRAGILPQGLRAECGTLDDVPVSARFDCILYVDVLEHIEDDRLELEKAASRLAVGGHLIVLAPAHQWLYSPFDRQIGHFRRYSRRSLLAIRPSSLKAAHVRYLDSVGLLASLANRVLLKASMPTPGQIRAWDRFMVPPSRWLDVLTFNRIGKSLLAVFTDSDHQHHRPQATLTLDRRP